jgi:cytochrome P450
LATDAKLFRRLQDDRSLVPPFIEEVIRLYPPAVITTRLAAVDTEIAGVPIPKGATIFVAWGSGNRDEEAFKSADEFRCPNPDGIEHLGFGHGPHFCVGNRLARTSLATSFNAFLDRYEKIELAVPEEELRYQPMINLRALVSLPIRCTKKVAA